MSKLAYLYNELFEQHNPGQYHPESPDRVKAINQFLEDKGFFQKAAQIHPDPVDAQELQIIHSPAHINLVMDAQGKDQVVLDSGDTVTNQYSVDAALTALGAAKKAVELVMNENYDQAFACVRPPGHHAESDRPMGFCLFNNAAFAAQYAKSFNKIKKVLIVDWDVHHGNGTEQIFYQDPNVFYFSLHQYPFYPGTGRAGDQGKDSGEGFNLNIPLAAGNGDAVYIQEFEKGLRKIEEVFKPDLIVISAGFDAHPNDTLGSMQVSDEGFYKMTEMLTYFAHRYCQGKIVSFLEGGYNLQALASSVYQHLSCLLKH